MKARTAGLGTQMIETGDVENLTGKVAFESRPNRDKKVIHANTWGWKALVRRLKCSTPESHSP